MDCAIWLNRRKIFSAEEISSNFDIAALRGYFLGGSLIKWLEAHGGEDYARLLNAISPDDPVLNDRLTEIFVQEKRPAPVHVADERLIRTIELLRGGAPAVTGSAQGGVMAGGSAPFGYGSFGERFGSFGYGSFSYSSFGSFSRSWEWEWEWRFGSFRGGSFNYNVSSYRGGSFSYGSFAGGSFRGAVGFGFSLGVPSSYRGVPVGGSFRPVSSDEYDEIMYRCLKMCPLNRFGYGIHLI